MSVADRKSLGKAGRTQAEANEKCEYRSEKELQKQILNLLRLRGIEVIVSRMDRKISNNVGTPDFLFSVLGRDNYRHCLYSCAIEVKLKKGVLSTAQMNMHAKMITPPNAWTYRVIHSVDEMRMFLEGLGL